MSKGKQLANKVRALRKDKGWSQAHLAEVCSVNERTIRRIEKGEVLPALETLQALAQALGVECSELVRAAEEAPKPRAKLQFAAVATGRQFFGGLVGAHAGSVDADDASSEGEADVVRELLDAMELAEIWDDLSPAQRYTEEQRVSGIVKRLQELGWGVWIERRLGTIKLPPSEHVPNPEPFPWVTTRTRVVKFTVEKLEKIEADLKAALKEAGIELPVDGGGSGGETVH